LIRTKGGEYRAENSLALLDFLGVKQLEADEPDG
jgi:hypothetical protein